jgi:hypothetical protein
MTKKLKKVLTKADLLSCQERTGYCELPSGKVLVRALSGKNLLDYHARIKQMGGKEDIDQGKALSLMAYLVYLTALNEDGTQMFTSEEEAQQLVGGVVENLILLANKAMELSGINPDAIAEVNKQLKNGMTSSSTVT